MPNLDPGDFSSAVGVSGSVPGGSPSIIGSPGLGNAVSDIFGSIGDFSEASAYSTAAKLAKQNALLAQESGKIQETQLARKVFQVTGQQAAASGASNFAASGSAMDVMRSSVQQGGLQHALIGLQAGIEQNSFNQQAAAYQGQANAADAAGAGNIVNSVLGFIGL